MWKVKRRAGREEATATIQDISNGSLAGGGTLEKGARLQARIGYDG